MWRQAAAVSVRADAILAQRVDGDQQHVRPAQGAGARQRAIGGMAARRAADDGDRAADAPSPR
jgi:hypothetical protein